VEIAKIASLSSHADYRPISITSVLSRCIKRFVVKSYIYPAISSPLPTLTFTDQFAFRPNGSTTAAIISFLHKVTSLLLTEQFVHVAVLDYSRAFDSLRHSSVHENLDKLPLPDNVHNWLTDYFEGHSHSTRFNGVTSTLRPINASVIQRSALGPAAFIVFVANLRPITPDNDMYKYADDVICVSLQPQGQPQSKTNSNISNCGLKKKP